MCIRDRIYAESVCVNKRALERVRVRRNCDDVSSEKFGFFFLSEITQQKPTNATKSEKSEKTSLRGRFWGQKKKKRDEQMRDERWKKEQKDKKSLQKNN